MSNKRRHTPTDIAIGNRIRYFRTRRGLSQTRVAEILGVTFQQVQKYEKGTNAVASTRVVDLCRAIGVTPTDLYGDETFLPEEYSTLSTWAIRTAVKLDSLTEAQKRAVVALLKSYEPL
jgi:transcriptional regulator with XRE-family HTH domain